VSRRLALDIDFEIIFSLFRTARALRPSSSLIRRYPANIYVVVLSADQNAAGTRCLRRRVHHPLAHPACFIGVSTGEIEVENKQRPMLDFA